MRNLLSRSSGVAPGRRGRRSLARLALLALLAVTACEAGAPAAKEPPALEVTAPVRSLLRGEAGTLRVTGTALPNSRGDAVEKVLVNGVAATLAADGSFHAVLDLPEGATLIHTVARDRNGVTASDTRAVHAGALRPVGTNITTALTAALSADAFARLSAAAGPILEGLDMAALLAPLQPMVHFDDENGEDCGFARLFVDDLDFADIAVSLSPVRGGLAFRAQIERLVVPARARYAVLCADGANNLRVTADRIVVAGTLQVTPNGMAGFTTRLASPSVAVTNFRLEASGIPGEILALLRLDSAIQLIVARAAELAMGPLVNQALGALAGPQQIDVLGKQLTMQVAPAALSFEPDGALVALDMRAMIAGSEASPGFIYTDNGVPAMDPAYGFQLGLADDLANEMLAELRAVGLLDLTMPTPSGAFDETRIGMTLPPMISAGAADGKLRLVLGDVTATFIRQGTPVGVAAINATAELVVAPAGNGYSVALDLGTPEIHVDVLDDIANATGLEDGSLASATAASLGAQLAAIRSLLAAIPVPAIAGLRVRDLAIESDDGYVMVTGALD
jgi:Glucodextranase, domain B